MSKIIRFLKRLKRFFTLFKSIKNAGAAWFLSLNNSNYHTYDQSLSWSDNKLIFNDHNFYFTKPEIDLFKKDLNTISVFFKKFIFFRTNNDLIISLYNNGSEIKILLENHEVISVINELFVERLYDIQTSKDVIVIDVGMNIGLSSLFFATYKNVKKVYSFEPAKGTFNKALINLSLNADISEKISCENVGLGKSDSIIKLHYNPEDNLSFSTVEGFYEDFKDDTNSNFTEVGIKNASSIFKEIIDNHKPMNKIILKMDCEGAEYEIIEDLRQSKYLDKIDAIILEWHVKGSEQIIKTLNEFNFISFSQVRPHTIPMGMIYAMKFE